MYADGVTLSKTDPEPYGVFKAAQVSDMLWRVTYAPTNTLAGYVTQIHVDEEVRYNAQQIRYGRLGASLGEYTTTEEAINAPACYKTP